MSVIFMGRSEFGFGRNWCRDRMRLSKFTLSKVTISFYQNFDLFEALSSDVVAEGRVFNTLDGVGRKRDR